MQQSATISANENASKSTQKEESAGGPMFVQGRWLGECTLWRKTNTRSLCFTGRHTLRAAPLSTIEGSKERRHKLWPAGSYCPIINVAHVNLTDSTQCIDSVDHSTRIKIGYSSCWPHVFSDKTLNYWLFNCLLCLKNKRNKRLMSCPPSIVCIKYSHTKWLFEPNLPPIHVFTHCASRFVLGAISICILA